MKTSCEACGSSDAKEIYPEGTAYCFSCETFFPNEKGETVTTQKAKTDLVPGGTYQTFRSISADTCKRFKYKLTDQGVHLAPYFSKEGDLIAQHLRYPGDKSQMPFRGAPEADMMMFGQQLWSAGASSRLVICEGEIDTLSVAEAVGTSWAVVGIPGIDRTKKVIKANLEFIIQFDEIVIMFDNDDPGRKGVKDALALLPHEKTKFVNEFEPECKDANDILQKYGTKALRNTIFYKAEKYIPQEVKRIDTIKVDKEDFNITLFPWNSWNRKLYARRSGELTVYTSGSGMGKSTILRAIYNSLADQEESCGLIMLEESTQETKADLMSHLINKPIRKILAQRAVNKAMEDKGLDPLFENVIELTDEEIADAEAQFNAKKNLYIVDHVGGYTAQFLVDKIRYMAVSLGVKHILLDHITLMISSDSTIENEVKSTDVIMKELRSLAEQYDINIDIISHIRKRGNGQKSTYGGAQITMEELRGSGSLYQVANNVICLERDQHDEENKNKTIVRSLKSRLSGYTGIIGELVYNTNTGELLDREVETEFKDETEDDTYG